jgi:diguanylate cyclase (GGDEF)-like protein
MAPAPAPNILNALEAGRKCRMKKSVIVIAERNTEIAPEITTILRESGVVVRMGDRWPFDHGAAPEKLIALIYQLPANPTSKNLRDSMRQLRSDAPELPVIGCAQSITNWQPRWRQMVTDAGFNAVAESAAQLPAVLREVEEHEPDNEPHQFKVPTEENDSTAVALLKKQELRGALTVISSLHGATNQADAASFSINGLGRLITAERWTVFLIHEHVEPGRRLATLATGAFAGSQPLGFNRNWQFEALGGDASSHLTASKATLEAVATAATVKRSEDRKRILATPLVSGHRVIGAVEGVRSRLSRSFSATDARVLEAVAPSVAHSLANSVRIADAERLSLTDELTRLHNARYLRQFLVNEIKRARRYRTKVAALFLDLDDFKHVNDLHGHLAGSHCLMEVAALLLPSVRDTDCVVRYGGDEFVMILPEAGPDDAGLVAERIRAKVEAHRFTGGRRLSISLTASIGAAVFPDNALSPHQLISSADQAMYAAKAGNKNCIRRAEHPMTDDPGKPDAQMLPGGQFQRIPDEKFIS